MAYDFPHKLNSFAISGQIFGLISSLLLYINGLPDDGICDIAIYADDTTLYSKCDQASDMWQQFELAFDLESDL